MSHRGFYNSFSIFDIGELSLVYVFSSRGFLPRKQLNFIVKIIADIIGYRSFFVSIIGDTRLFKLDELYRLPSKILRYQSNTLSIIIELLYCHRLQHTMLGCQNDKSELYCVDSEFESKAP